MASVWAQQVSGFVFNQENEPVPFATIYVQEAGTGTATAEDGSYLITLNPGNYHLIISSVGYRPQKVNLTILEKPIEKNFWLQYAATELNEIAIRAKGRDPAYAIIEKASKQRKRYLNEAPSYRTHLYVKAIEEQKNTPKKPRKRKAEEDLNLKEPVDPFEQERLKLEEESRKINMVELQLNLNFQAPDQYKEERTAYKRYGSKAGLYIPIFSQIDFNFYESLVALPGIAEAPVISPLSRTAILAYKFKLIETFIEGEQTVFQIQVIPRKTSNSTVKGMIFINDQSWNINRLDFDLQKGGLRFYDRFNLKQRYQQVADSAWTFGAQTFTYSTKSSKYKRFEGKTTIHYSDFQHNYVFPEKFFGNEVAVTTAEAYERDSTYWRSSRPEPLSQKEQLMVLYRDSIEAYHKSPAYIDSVDSAFNRLTLGEILLHGVGFQNTESKRRMSFGSLAYLLEFEVVGGFRIGPYADYFKRWKNGRYLRTFGNLTVGLKNGDVNWGANSWYQYQPHKQGAVTFNAGRDFISINPYDAYIRQLQVANYILRQSIGGSHRRELFNGFFLHTGAAWVDRQSVNRLDSDTFLEPVVGETEGIAFEGYEALITEVAISYTPAQQYMTEPNRKIIIGSKYPRFTLTHTKGWNGILSSDIDFDQIEFRINQQIRFGVIGNTNYNIMMGKFLNTKDLRIVDIKRFPESNPYLYSNPLNSFQLLDTAITTSRWFFEAHHIHHFNGALINNIPLVKKLRVHVVAGGGFFLSKEGNYRYEEVYSGLERVFKLGARRRLRLGIYGVVAESTLRGFNSSFMISFDVIDTWQRDWSF